VNDLTLHHRTVLDPSQRRVVGKCVWCGQDSQIVALTPFRPDLGALPLHLTCGVMLRDAYKDLKAGRALHPADQANMLRFGQATALIEAGS
jgi:hypothetical protein